MAAILQEMVYPFCVSIGIGISHFQNFRYFSRTFEIQFLHLCIRNL